MPRRPDEELHDQTSHEFAYDVDEVTRVREIIDRELPVNTWPVPLPRDSFGETGP